LKNSKFEYDLIVIGAGSGGVRAARVAAGHGAKVAVIEEERPGGTCVLRGCIPKKLLVYASEFKKQIFDSRGFGWEVKDFSHNWNNLNLSLKKELDRLSEVYKSILSNSGCKLINGAASLVGNHEVEVNNKIIQSKKILLATGGVPYVPEIDGLRKYAITSNEALKLSNLPKTIVIMGSGYIAIEFACIFSGFGSKVHLIYRADLPLKGFDSEIRKNLEIELQKKGINLYPNSKILSVKEKDKLIITLNDNNKITADQILAATGRIPNVKKLNLENVGIDLSPENSVIVDKNSRTNINSVYAIGDVTNKINLTPVALGEGHAFADREYGNILRYFEYDNVPYAVFSQPPVSAVGLTQEEALNLGYELDIYSSNFKPLKNTLSESEERSFMKLVVDKSTRVVLGAHMLGSDAPEIMQSIAIAVKAKLKKEDFDLTVGIHPSAAEEFVTMRTAKN